MIEVQIYLFIAIAALINRKRIKYSILWTAPETDQ